ncbi:MAG: OsmC-related (seleno)protein [Alphaproteobacteria bacterium]
MPAAPGIIDLGKFRVAYEEARERPSDGTDGYFLQQRALIRLNEDLVKIARPEDCTVLCDEANFKNGSRDRPSPLQYFIASIGFCMYSQMSRFAARLEVPLGNAQMNLCITYDLRTKSRLNDMATAAQALNYRFDIESTAPLERVIRLAQLTDKGCHTVNSMRNRLPVTSQWVYNGREFDIND